MSGIDACLLDAMALPGARGAALVEWVSGLALGRAGEAPGGDHDAMAARMAELARTAAEHETPGTKGGPAAVEELVVVTGDGYHVLRFVEAPYEGGIFLHLWLERTRANLAMAMLRLRTLAEGLVLA